MLLTGLDHVAVMTADTDAFVAFFAEVFGAASRENPDMPPGMRLFFVGPDGLEAEVCVPNPDAVPGVMNPPGTPARRFHPTPG
jgi:catechol 2,3-dioxygenase-like lactoylglutathione lyase family enzyme